MGAGISAPSGLKTFMDNDGLWEEYDVMQVCSAEGFAKDPKTVLSFYDTRRAQLKDVAPNHAHKVIAKLKETYKDRLFIVTQNADDLLERAGCKDAIHLHGFLPEIYCMQCATIANIIYESINERVCEKCGGASMRHNIVMFNEPAPQYSRLYSLMNEVGLFISIGTSGMVLPVWQFAKQYRFSIINALELGTMGSFFNKAYDQDVVVAIDFIKEDIENFFLHGAL